MVEHSVSFRVLLVHRSRSRDRNDSEITHDPNSNNCRCNDCKPNDSGSTGASPRRSQSATFAEQAKKGNMLRIFAKRARFVYSGIKLQMSKFTVSVSAETMKKFESATEFGLILQSQFEEHLSIQIDWGFIKKEAHPAGPLALMKPGDDYHMNAFIVWVVKLSSVRYEAFILYLNQKDGVKFHLCEKDRRNIPDAPRFVCASDLFFFYNFSAFELCTI